MNDLMRCFQMFRRKVSILSVFNLHRGSLLLPFFAACATVHESADREIGQHDHVYMEAWLVRESQDHTKCKLVDLYTIYTVYCLNSKYVRIKIIL